MLNSVLRIRFGRRYRPKQAILSDKGLMRNIAAAAQMIVDAYEQGKKNALGR